MPLDKHALVEQLATSGLLVVLAAMLCVAGVAADDSVREQRLAAARAYWEREYTRVASQPEAAGYATEAAIPFLSAYAATREARYAEQAARQLDYAHSIENSGMAVLRGREAPTTSRDVQARQIYNFYLGYRILADGRYLRWADACAEAMIETIPRASHECAGQSHTQFAGNLINMADPEAGRTVYVIDVNQNAEVGLAFGLLYHDPGSAFFRNPLAKEIALEETLASMSIQNMETGAIPLTETSDRIEHYDTAYGSYAAFSWVWSQLLWNDARMDEHIRAAGRWLGAKMDLSKDSDRYYSFRNPSTYMPAWEASYRLPVYWYCGVDAGEFIAGLFKRMPEATPGDFFVTLWAYYDLMGMPRTYYIDGQVEADG